MLVSKRILNIGPRISDQNNLGGIVVLFENWLHFCRTHQISFIIVDSNKQYTRCKLFAYLRILLNVWHNINNVDIVMLHGTAKDFQWIAPIVVFIARRHEKKIVLRKFAGHFAEFYNQQRGIRKQLLKYVLRNSDILYWETLSLVSFFQDRYPNVHNMWFPNSRIRQTRRRSENTPYQRRFVFLSRVEKEKGVDVLMGAFLKLGPQYTLDIYGPLCGYETHHVNNVNCHYKGVVPSESVNSVLTQYDVLVLPTCWKTEGYPGIIMESFNAGIPVIASCIGGIPELVQDGRNGFLVEPGSIEDFIKAVHKLEHYNFSTLCKQSYLSFDKYDSGIVNQRVLNDLLLM